MAVPRAAGTAAAGAAAAARRGGLRRRAALRARRRLRCRWPPARRRGCGARARGVRVTRASTRAASWRSSPSLLTLRVRAGALRCRRRARGRPAARSRRRCAPGGGGAASHPGALRRAAGARCSPPPRVVVRDPFGLRRAARRDRRGPTRCSCCRAWSPCAARAPRTAATGTAAAARAPDRRGRGGPRRPAPAPRGRAGLAHLLARAGPRRRAAWSAGCAPRATRGRSSCSTRARPRPRRTSTRRSAPRPRSPSHLARAGGCALLLPGDRRPTGLDATLAGWTALHVRLALLEAGPARPSPASASRRGPVLLVAARRVAPRAARAGAGRRRGAAARRARRLPAGAPVLAVAGCTGYDLVERHVRPGAACGRRRSDVSAARLARGPARAAAGAPARARPDRRRPAPAPAPRGLRPAGALRAGPVGRARAPGRHRPRPGSRSSRGSGPRSSLVAPARRRPSRAASRPAAALVAGARARRRAASAGVPAALLGPAHWDELRTGVSQGVDAMPGVTVPYRGSDAWVAHRDPARRHAAGRARRAAGLLAAAPGAPRACAGRRRRRAGALYADPGRRAGPERPFLGGAVFALLLGRCSSGSSACAPRQVGAGRRGPALATVVGLAAAPLLDARAAVARLPGARRASCEPRAAEHFDWDHRYAPLDWPRDGREVLRDQGPRLAPTGRPTSLERLRRRALARRARTRSAEPGRRPSRAACTRSGCRR